MPVGNIALIHLIQLTLSLTCLIMHFVSKESRGYEYQFAPLFRLTFVGCTAILILIVAVEAARFAQAWDRYQIKTVRLTRTKIIFNVIAFVLYMTCGTVSAIYDERPEQLLKGAMAALNGICFLVDFVFCNSCQYPWGAEMGSDHAQRSSEQQPIYQDATSYQ